MIKIAQVDIMEILDRAFVHGRDYLKKDDKQTWHSWTDILLYQNHRENIARLTVSLNDNLK